MALPKKREPVEKKLEPILKEFSTLVQAAMRYPEFRALMVYGLIDMFEAESRGRGPTERGLALGIWGPTIGYELKPVVKANLVTQGTIKPLITSVAELGDIIKALSGMPQIGGVPKK